MGSDTTGGGRTHDGSHRTRGQRVITQVEIESDIVHVSETMEEVLSDLIDMAEANARAEHAYKVKRAVKTLECSGKAGQGPGGRTTVDERDAMVMADQACSDLFLEHLIAEARHEAAKQTLNVLRTRMDGLRTIASNIRAQT